MTAFFQRSLTAAEHFLQTAVVIDDKAFDEHAVVDVPTDIVEPASLALPSPITSSTVSGLGYNQEASMSSDEDSHALDAERVINGFARKKIVCSILKRRKGDDFDSPDGRAHLLATAADILVLDWSFPAEDLGMEGEKALGFVRDIVASSKETHPEQLRLILVYTGVKDLEGVMLSVRKRLTENSHEIAPDGVFALRAGATRIVVFGKSGVDRVGESKKRSVTYEELAESAVAEFARMTSGLISNVVVESLAQIRQATHRILARFGPHLDAPFLAHRALIDPPEDASDHLFPLIVSELHAIVEGGDAVSLVSTEVIKEWFEAVCSLRTDGTPSVGFASIAEECEFVGEICSIGLPKRLKKPLPDSHQWLATAANGKGSADLNKLLTLFDPQAHESFNDELAILMALKTRYGSVPPVLTLGTIVRVEMEKPTYWLCLQPVCDCVRIPNSRSFPMLRLSAVESGGKFNVVVKIDRELVRLRIDPRPFKIQSTEFKADKSLGMVVAKKDEQGNFRFEAKNPVSQCRWIGELRFEQAHRAVQAFAHQNARVGLTESEWLRRWDQGRASE